MILYNFYCNFCATPFEGFAKMTQTQKECPNCGKTAGRCLSMPRIKLDGCDPSFSTEYGKWAKRHEQAARIARKRDDFGGEYNGDN
jgi:putative FmdB family regulatory protein